MVTLRSELNFVGQPEVSLPSASWNHHHRHVLFCSLLFSVFFLFLFFFLLVVVFFFGVCPLLLYDAHTVAAKRDDTAAWHDRGGGGADLPARLALVRHSADARPAWHVGPLPMTRMLPLCMPGGG